MTALHDFGAVVLEILETDEAPRYVNPPTSMKLWQATLRLSKPGTSCTDDDLTEEILNQHRMGENAARVVKRLWGDAFSRVDRQDRRIRTDYHRLTFDGIGNIRLLVVSERQVFLDKMREHAATRAAITAGILANYDEILERERTDKNGAFRIEDYPTRNALADSFGFSFNVLPMPSPNQFLVDGITDDLSASLAAEYEQKLANAEANVRRTVLNTLLGLITDTAESLAGEGPIIDTENRKGTFAKLQEYLDRIPSLNITNDPDIAAIYALARQKLSVSSDYLRASKTARAAASIHASNIATKFGAVTRKLQLRKPAPTEPAAPTIDVSLAV